MDHWQYYIASTFDSKACDDSDAGHGGELFHFDRVV